MASILSAEHIGSRLSITPYHHAPASASALIIVPDGTTKKLMDMSLFEFFAAAFKNAALTGAGITKAEIVATSDALGVADVTVVKDSGTIALNDSTKWGFLECTAEEVANLGAQGGTNLRYVGLRLTLANSADLATAVYIGIPRHPHRALTPSGLNTAP